MAVAAVVSGCTLVTSLEGLQGDGPRPLDALTDVPTWDDATTVDGAGEADAPIDAGPCDRSKPFGAPVAVDGLALDGRGEEAVRFTADLHTAWVLVRVPDLNGVTASIQIFDRASESAPFTTGVDVGIPSASLGTTGSSGAFGSSADTLRLVYGDAQGRLIDCRRSTSSVSFAGTCSVIGDGATPYLAASGTRIYAPAAGPQGDWVPSTLDWVTPKWTPPLKIAELDLYGAPTAFHHPVLTTNEKTIVFEADESIYVAHWAQVGFGPPEKLTELTVKNATTHPAWISDDECTIALVSNRKASMDVFLAKRPK